MPLRDPFTLTGKVALVTGGAGIVGQGIFRALAESGATAITAARTLEKGEKLASVLRAEGLNAHAMICDQADEASVLSLRDQILGKWGRIDILVNNAVTRPMKEGHTGPASTFAASMEVNATGLFIITRAFGDVMAERKQGSIVNISSIQGVIGPDATLYEGLPMNGWYPDYFFHKGGMINFTRYVASYYGRFGVRCNGLIPGGFVQETTSPEFVRRYSARTFLGRMANPADIGGAVVFLAGDASAYITGANLPVDGGYTAK
jgi:NAD(P)-dependent dehydrogenase (short-subunit alcohol dehydrogenase family)